MRLAATHENVIFEITSPINTGPYLRIADESGIYTPNSLKMLSSNKDSNSTIKKFVFGTTRTYTRSLYFVSPENSLYTGCNRRNVRDFGRVFLMLNYTDITQNTYIQS